MTDINRHSLLDTNDRRWLKLLITPSWFSMLVAICCSFAVLIGVVLAANYQGTSLQQQVAQARAQQINAHYSSDDEMFEGIQGNTFLDVAPLMFMWAVVGIIVFYFSVAIVQALQHAVEFKEELDYVNADRNGMIRTAFMHLAIRLIVGVLWVLFIVGFFGTVLPYAVNSALAVAALGLDPESLLYAVLCLLAVGISVHINTIFLRLLMFKPRVFNKALYLS